jgi:hypothetical protein
MNTKDHALIARALRDARPVSIPASDMRLIPWSSAVNELADALKRENPRTFDAAEFFRTCDAYADAFTEPMREFRAQAAKAQADETLAPEPVVSVRIHERHVGPRPYVAITVVIADLHLYCDLVSNRQIRLAAALARRSGIELDVASELRERVAAALAEAST